MSAAKNILANLGCKAALPAAQALSGTLNGTTTTNRFPFLFISNTSATVTANVAVNAATTGMSANHTHANTAAVASTTADTAHLHTMTGTYVVYLIKT